MEVKRDKNHPRYDQDVILCDNCESNIVSPTMHTTTIGVLLMLSVLIWVWIPILGWIFAPFAFIGGLILVIIGSSKPNRNFSCVECKHSFSVDRKTYKKWNVYGKDKRALAK